MPRLQPTFSQAVSQPSSLIYCTACLLYLQPAKFRTNRIGAPYQPCIDCTSVGLLFSLLTFYLYLYILLDLHVLVVYVLLLLPQSKAQSRNGPELYRLHAVGLRLLKIHLLSPLYVRRFLLHPRVLSYNGLEQYLLVVVDLNLLKT